MQSDGNPIGPKSKIKVIQGGWAPPKPPAIPEDIIKGFPPPKAPKPPKPKK